MAVFRVERTRDYTVMCNHHLKDSNLSLKAKGLLSMMLSLPDEWNYTTRGLAAICKEGVDAIGKTLKELELAGYIIRRQLRGKDGRISDTEYTIFEKPRKPSPPDTTLPDTENPYLDNPDTEAPDTDNPAQLNTKKSNTQKSNTDLSSTHSFFLPAADGMTDGFEKKAEIREQKLTRTERKQIEAAIARANRTDKKEKSAQDSIPYQRMWPDGICRVTDTRYTKTIQYQDINYQLSQNEDKTAIFEAWCDFLNYFDSSVQFQLSFVNLSASQETFARSISIPPCGDEFDSIRAEYAGMLQNQLARGNNGLIKTKYLTFGVEADNLRAAKPRLERIETDLLNNFKRLGVVAAPLNGFERLHVMHDILRMDEQEPFRFSWDWLAPSGLSTKDFIAPSSFEFKTGRMFRMGKKLGAISFVQILAPELNDRMLADFLDMESSVLVNLHVQSVDQVNAIKTVKRKITDLDKSKIEEQKKAVRAGYDMDISATRS